MNTVQKINANYYDATAAVWAEQKTHSFYDEKQFRAFIKYFMRGGCILDVGCGHARSAPLFLGIGRHLNYEGIDSSRVLLAIARRRYPHLKFSYADITDARTLPRKKFSGFWAAATLQHVPFDEWPLMWKNLTHMMQPCAIGYLTLPNDRPDVSQKDPRYFSVISHAQFSTFARARGVRIVRHGTIGATRGTTTWRWYIIQLPK